MKIPINLASQPFRRDRAMLAASIGVSALLVLTLGAQIALIVAARGQMADVRQDIARLNRLIREQSAEQAKLSLVLNKPENADVLIQSVFLNTLLTRKGISWTRIFSDLEKTIPYDTKVISIRPTVDRDNRVRLDMIVAAETTAAYLKMVLALENSSLFGEVTELQRIPPAQADPLWRWHVTVIYAQS